VSQWLNLLIETGFVLERIEEARPSDEVVRECPRIQDTQVVAYFLYIRARKPGADLPGSSQLLGKQATGHTPERFKAE
jgi:hypothetical protein